MIRLQTVTILDTTAIEIHRDGKLVLSTAYPEQVVAKLTPDDMLNIVAYTASLPAPAAAPTKAASN